MIESYRGARTVEHWGGLFGYRAEFLQFPEQRFTVICYCNVSTAMPALLARKVADLYLETKLEPAADSSSSSSVATSGSDLASLAGKYYDPAHTVVSIELLAGTLAWRRSPLRRLTASEFEADIGSRLAFSDLDATVSVGFTNNNNEKLGTAVKLRAFRLIEGALPKYAGTYKSKELDAVYKPSVENGSLTLQTNWSKGTSLDPIMHDKFFGTYRTLEFYRDAADRISGFKLFDPRVRNVTFARTN